VAPGSLRVYLTGRMCVEADGTLLDAAAFPGMQGRLAFAYLVSERSRPIARSELVEALWPGALPPSYETALSAVVSRLRALLGRAGLPGATALASGAGCYELRLPPSAWVDVEAASDAVHEAEAALAADDPGRAYGPSAVAHHIARRPFLPGAEGPWVDGRRARLRSILLRALDCRARVYLWNREPALAVEAAREIVALEPFRETGHQLLIRAHAASGNAAEALRAYERCRRLIAEELGVDPSRQTKAEYEAVLASL
jgi:SARP family transcriptional regulator, regulator of embCAB operon